MTYSTNTAACPIASYSIVTFADTAVAYTHASIGFNAGTSTISVSLCSSINEKFKLKGSSSSLKNVYTTFTAYVCGFETVSVNVNA